MRCSFFIAFLLFSNLALANHPDVRHITLDGQEHVCRPSSAKVYCPQLALDVPLNVHANIERQNCLDALHERPAKKDLLGCFISKQHRLFFEQIQILDVGVECIRKNLDYCKEYSPCSRGTCGNLGSFLSDIGRRGWNDIFSKEDGEHSCDTLIDWDK